jgi:hypothetical protein
MGEAGWSDIDIVFYNTAWAMPDNGSVTEWVEVRCGSFEKFVRLWGEADRTGATVGALLVREAGVDRWHRSAELSREWKSLRAQSVSVRVLREMLLERGRCVAFALETRQYERARALLRGDEGVTYEW